MMWSEFRLTTIRLQWYLVAGAIAAATSLTVIEYERGFIWLGETWENVWSNTDSTHPELR